MQSTPKLIFQRCKSYFVPNGLLRISCSIWHEDFS
jgi:hypothetical protein